MKLEPLSTENYAVGFAKDGDQAMSTRVNKTLKEMYDDGTIAKLCEKWGEYGISNLINCPGFARLTDRPT